MTATSRTPLVYSATPTPLTPDASIDTASLRKCIDHHIALGCDGAMLGGTCGEGPWLRDSDLETLVRTGLDQTAGRMKISAQVTDNSPGRILDRIENLATWGADFGVVAQPFFFMNATPQRLRDFYLEIFEKSALPVYFYDRGKASSVAVPQEILADLVSHPRVIGVKDSACDAERFAIIKAVRDQRPELNILNGNEFSTVESTLAGYDGAFYGGAVLTAKAVRQTIELIASGDLAAAEALDAQTKEVLFDVYGGPKITCWLAGLKYTLVQLGLFSEWTNIPGYPLTEECRAAVDRDVTTIPWLKP
jgi:4-hydroxy-tetrahydrodipicolinate synthase